jgi:DNA-binding transcriptional ArsR family regulator
MDNLVFRTLFLPILFSWQIASQYIILMTRTEKCFVEKATGAIADHYRLSILKELSQRGSLTSTDVQELTGLSQPCVSHHVKLLTDSGLVNAQKEGRNLHLTLNKQSIQSLSDFLKELA